MNTAPLKHLGMTPKEIDVYLALISLKSASIFQLKSRARTSRKSIYEILQRLLDRGLISYTVKDGKKMFSAAHPERLIEIVREKEDEIKSILPQIEARYNENNESTKVEVFLGANGIKTISENVLRVGKPMYAVSGNAEMYDHLKYYTAQYLKRREALGIHRKAVYNDGARAKKLCPPLTEIRYAPRGYESPLQFTVYGDNVNMHIYADVIVGIHIQSKAVAESFMNYFRLMWEIAKP